MHIRDVCASLESRAYVPHITLPFSLWFSVAPAEGTCHLCDGSIAHRGVQPSHVESEVCIYICKVWVKHTYWDRSVFNIKEHFEEQQNLHTGVKTQLGERMLVRHAQSPGFDTQYLRKQN